MKAKRIYVTPCIKEIACVQKFHICVSGEDRDIDGSTIHGGPDVPKPSRWFDQDEEESEDELF